MRGRRYGFSLEEIRQWLLIYEQKGSKEQYQVWLDLADRQLNVMGEQIAELETARADLKALRETAAKELTDMK